MHEGTAFMVGLIFACVVTGMLSVVIYKSRTIDNVTNLVKAIENNTSVRQFMYNKYPNQYKLKYTDWKDFQ